MVSSWKETGDVPPKCPNCNGLLRPDVVWFEEALPEKPFQDAMRASRDCEVFFSIGTSALVYPAASLHFEAQSSGALVVEINPHRTPSATEPTVSSKVPRVLFSPSSSWPSRLSPPEL